MNYICTWKNVLTFEVSYYCRLHCIPGLLLFILFLLWLWAIWWQWQYNFTNTIISHNIQQLNKEFISSLIDIIKINHIFIILQWYTSAMQNACLVDPKSNIFGTYLQIKHLCSIGGATPKDVTDRMMACVLTTPLARTFNWAGRHGKVGLKGHTIVDVIKGNQDFSNTNV